MRRAASVSFLLLAPCLLAQAPAWKPAPCRLPTQWTAQVTPENAWPQYPRPTLRRDAWQNLNGVWDYAITNGDAPMPDKADGQILVPFPVESSLSGVGKPLRPDQRLWYRRTFTLPDEYGSLGTRVLLHCDAIDWECEVWVDGTRVGGHRGGYDRCSFDVTSAFAASPQHELRIGVRDPSDAGTQPRGKQVQKPNGIWYTPTSGIWQTVWLEPVPATWIRSVRSTVVEKDGMRTARVHLDVAEAQAGDTWSAFLHLPNDPKTGAGDTKPVGTTIDLDVARSLVGRWSPAHPNLGELRVEVRRDQAIVDSVQCTFADRDLTVGRDASGTTRLLLNGEPVFQFGPLDQGFWPDGLYTPPNHAAMCSDLDAAIAMGCNMLRKHVKVESELFYHECDKRGLLVWQDMPSGDTHQDPATFERELRALIETHRQHPSIVMWVVFNEGWGQHDTRRYVDLARQLDPTRWIGNASGWTDAKCGDVIDVHVYPGPGMAPAEDRRAAVLGEFGGLGLPLDGHTWAAKDNWGYVSYRDSDELSRAYVARIDALRPLIAQGLCAAVYTQTTDVEIEVNGWLTYDRAVTKVDVKAAAAATRRLYEPPGALQWLVATAQQGPQRWRWTTAEPPAAWQDAAFNDAAWNEGPGGFGTKGTPGARPGTAWNTPSIWLRRTIELPAAPLRDPFLCLHHDEDVEVFVDGERVLARSGYTTDYLFEPVPPAARARLTPGHHVLAVHCRQTRGGQYVDVGLVDLAAR